MALDPVTSINLLRAFVIRPLRNRRRAKRGLPPLGQQEVVMPEVVRVISEDGTETTRTEPTIPLRTSTKAFIGSAIGAYPGWQIVQAVQEVMFSTPWIEEFTNSALFVWLCATIIPLIIARFTKSPSAKSAV